MLESNNLALAENIILNFCNDIIVENKKNENEKTSDEICIKMIDYLMF